MLMFAAVMTLFIAAPTLADPYFRLDTFDDWNSALGSGQIVPLLPSEWDQYMSEWDLFLEEGEPYPDTVFLPPTLYPYEGPDFEEPGLVMAWGPDDELPGDYASAWKFDYQVDPDLSNAVITVTVYPPQFGANGQINAVSFGIQDINGNTKSWFWNVGPGGLPWNVGTLVTINAGQVGLNATNPPASGFMMNPGFNVVTSQAFILDENAVWLGGPLPIPPVGGPSTALWNYWYQMSVQPISQSRYGFEFSLDIGSDIELSDPQFDGDEAADPGDVYWWQSASIVPPGRDGFKDDLNIFGFDPWPDPPDAVFPPATRVPVGMGTIQDYYEYFDLDGHDQLETDIFELQLIPPEAPLPGPIPMFTASCIYTVDHLIISMDDDMAPGWPVADVPIGMPSSAGFIYGMTGANDEVIGVDLFTAGGPPPYPPLIIYPIADELTVHGSMAPNPDNGDIDDDDVDSLDIVPDQEACPVWYFTADHEAHLGLDPGDIYEVTAGGPIKVVDEWIHLGVPEDADIDAFEFVWLVDPQDPTGMLSFGIVFSVDEDDPLTPGVDESGGLLPMVIYGSVFCGYHFPVSDPMWDDVDALTSWH